MNVNSIAGVCLSAALLAACGGSGGPSSNPVAPLDGAPAANVSAATRITPNRSIVRPTSMTFASPNARTQIARVLGYGRARSLFGGNCSSNGIASVSIQRFVRSGARFAVSPISAGRCKEYFGNDYGLRGTVSIFVRK
jgi:hypothetical protein